jgi:hypothetical protein
MSGVDAIAADLAGAQDTHGASASTTTTPTTITPTTPPSTTTPTRPTTSTTATQQQQQHQHQQLPNKLANISARPRPGTKHYRSDKASPHSMGMPMNAFVYML